MLHSDMLKEPFAFQGIIPRQIMIIVLWRLAVASSGYLWIKIQQMNAIV